MRSLEWNRQAAQTPLAMALLNRFDRPAAISDPQGCLVAMNAAFAGIGGSAVTASKPARIR